MESSLKLTEKSAWTLENAPLIAVAFGYIADSEFQKALGLYIKQFVEPAKITDFLSVFATRHFQDWQPPLTRIQKT